MQRVAGLPDLQPGRGYPVGAAFFFIDRFYPALNGGDPSCGMRLLQTDMPTAKVSAAKLVKREQEKWAQQKGQRRLLHLDLQ